MRLRPDMMAASAHPERVFHPTNVFSPPEAQESAPIDAVPDQLLFRPERGAQGLPMFIKSQDGRLINTAYLASLQKHVRSDGTCSIGAIAIGHSDSYVVLGDFANEAQAQPVFAALEARLQEKGELIEMTPIVPG